MKKNVKLLLLIMFVLLSVLQGVSVYADNDIVLDETYSNDPNNRVDLGNGQFAYRTIRLMGVEGYEDEWITLHLAYIKLNPLDETQGGFPFYSHGKYLDEDPLNPPAYSFENMMKIYQNSHSRVGAGANVEYFVNKKFADGYPNFKDRNGLNTDYNNVPQAKGSGHFPHPVLDPTGKFKGEWRFLGYGLDFQVITNPFFPADVPASNPDKRIMAKTYNWLKNPWEYFVEIKRTDYNRPPYKQEAIDSMKKFNDKFGFFLNNGGGALQTDMTNAPTEEKKAEDLLSYLNLEGTPTDKLSGSATGAHRSKASGITYYATFFLPAKIPLNNTNLKIASPLTKVIDGKTYNNGGLTDDQGVFRNSVEIYEKNPDGTRGKLVSVMPSGGLAEGQYNAELIAGKEYIYVAYVRFYDLPVTNNMRKTLETIKLYKDYNYNNKDVANSAFNLTSEEFDSKSGEQFNNKPLVVGKTKIFEWIEAIPAQINGEKINELELTLNLGGKKTLPDGTVVSYPVDNIFTTKDDSSTIKIKIKDAQPNLTVASPNSSVTADDGTVKSNLELYEISDTGALTKVAISDTKDSKGFNGYVEKHKRYAVRAYINNNPVIPPHATKSNVTANIELNYNQKNTGNYKEGNTAQDSKQYRAGDTGIYTATPILPGKTEAIEYQFEVKDKIDNNTTTTLKIMASIANGINCDVTDNSILTDDKTEIYLGIGLPSLPNLKVMSANYPDTDNSGITRNRIEVYEKKTNKLLNPATDRLVRGETYIFKTYMKYYPNPNVPKQAGSTIATEIRLDRWLSYKKGVGEITNLSAMGGQASPYLKFGRLTAPNRATATFIEEIKIPMDADLSPFRYRVRVDPIHLNGDNQQTTMDDEAEAVFELDAVAPNLIIDKIEARIVGSNTVIPPGERLQPGKTYNFKVYMRYANPNPLVTTVNSNILCDYGISTDYLSYLPKGSIYETGTAKLVSTNFNGKKMKAGDVSVFSYNYMINLNMGNTLTFEARVPSIYDIDNAIKSDDKMSVSYSLGAEDLMAYDMAFYYNNSKITDGKMKAIPSTAVYQAKFKVKKVAGTTKTSPVQVYVQVQDMAKNVLIGQTLTGRALNGLNDEQEFVINNIRPDNSTKLTAIAQIATIHATKGENSNPTNDITMATIGAEHIDLSIASFKVNPIKVTVGDGDILKPMNLGFNAQVTNETSLNSSVGNGVNSVAFIIRDSYNNIIFTKYVILPPNKTVGVSYTIPNYQLRNGNNVFTAEINHYRNPVEISSTHEDPYWNNRATASTLVEYTNDEIPCEKGITTTIKNSWSETFYITKRWGTKRSYDCSYTNKQGRYVRRTCYYCDPDNWDFSERTVRFTETISIPKVFFRSQYTIDKYGGDGWINIANGTEGEVRPGSGFEMRIYTNFRSTRNQARPLSRYKDMCNYTSVSPGVYTQSNTQRITVTIPKFKDSKGNPVVYSMYPLSESGNWDNSTKEFQFPLRNAFGKEYNRKIYIGENVKSGTVINFKIVTQKFEPYEWGQGQKYLQECKTVNVRVVGSVKIRSHIVN